MKIASNRVDAKSATGSMVLIPTCPDDLYVLSAIVAPGDDVEAFTTRKLSMDGGRTQQKITTRLMVRAETTDFDLEDGIMSIKGKISKENEYVQQGAYHTLHIPLDERFELFKKRWTREDQRALAEATKDIPSLCFIIFYDRECVVSTVTPNTIKNVYKGEVKSKAYKPVMAAVAGIKDSMKVVVVASFSGAGEDFHKALVKENRGMEKHTSSIRLPPEYKNMPNTRVIGRVLTDKRFSKSFSEIKYVDDLREVEEFFLGLTLGNKKMCLGLCEVREAFEYGAIKTLFVTDALYRPRTVEERKSIEGIIGQATEMRARVCVIPIVHEHGERLRLMGGIAGILQFTYK